MQAQGSALSASERVSLAEYLTGQKIGAMASSAGRCTGAPRRFSLDGPLFNGWGGTPRNWRYQPRPGISATQLDRLAVKWAFGFPGAVASFGQPTIAGGRVFAGSQNGHVYSLDARTGCSHWDYAAGAGVRTAITVARIDSRHVALFGDRRGSAYSVDVATGKTIWKVTVDDAPRVQITGSPTLFEGKLYVPISVGDDSSAIDPKYECCKGRGAVAALDAATGKEIWKTYTLPEATPQGKNSVGTQLWGPSGVSVWAARKHGLRTSMTSVGTPTEGAGPRWGCSG